MRLTRDYFENIEIPSYVLCKANGERIGEIQCVDNKTLSINELNEITFDTYKYIDGVENELYDLITEMKYVLLPGMFKFIITSVDETDDGVNPKKDVTAQSMEVNLGQRYLEQFYINNGEDYAINDVCLYNPNDPSKSLLDLVLSEKCPDWHVGHVDADIMYNQRFFEIERTDVYSFLTNDVANAFEAVIIFNSWNMTVNAYKEENWGSDTNIYLTFDNLLQNTTLSSSVDDIKTCMTVVGADDLNLREVNMGSDRLYMFDYYATTEFMSEGLCEAYAAWKQKMADGRAEYAECVNETLALYHDIDYLMNEKMPTFGDNKLVLPTASPVTISGVEFVTDSYAQTITCNGTAEYDIEYVLSRSLNEVLEVDEFYKFNGCPVEPSAETFPDPRLQDYYILWYNPSDPGSKEEITAIDKGYGNEKKYEEGYDKISIIIKAGTELEDVKFIPAVYKPESECKDWDRYGLNPLKEKLAEYEGKQAVMMKSGWADESNPNYETWYLPVYNTINDINAQIKVVELELSGLNDQLNAVHARMSEIAVECSMDNNFTDDQIIELSRFIREESINSDNYVITDSMTDEERVKMLEDMLEYGETELRKVSQPQIQFNVSLVNLFNMKEFDDVSPDFERGNYVHVILRDDYVVKAKLLSMEFDFLNMENMSVTFGNTNKTRERTMFTDITKAINAATSVSTTVSVKGSYWNAANKDINDVNDMLSEGLLSAGQTINTSSADVTIDNRGILLSSTDPNYPDDKILIGGSRILFSDDGLKTVREAVGRCKYIDRQGVVHDDFGVISDFVIAGYINGTTIDSSDISVGGTSDGKIIMYDSNGNERGRWDVNGLILPPGTKVQWANVEDAPTIPTKTSEIENDSNFQTPESIKSTVITKDYIESLDIRAGSVNADNITGNSIKGKSIGLIMDSGNTVPGSTNGFILSSRHVMNSDFDFNQANICSKGGLIIHNRKNVNTAQTPETQNDYKFYQINAGYLYGLNNPAMFELIERDGHIDKEYEYVDDADDDYEQRFEKHNREINHIEYDGNPKKVFQIKYDGTILSYNGDDYAAFNSEVIGLHKNNKNAYGGFAKYRNIYDYGSATIDDGQAVTVQIDADLLAIGCSSTTYKVFITDTSDKPTTYVEKGNGSFIVHGTNGATFDYQVVLYRTNNS